MKSLHSNSNMFNDISAWVDSFLRTDGNDIYLADQLKIQSHFWVGPLRVPLHDLKQTCGPKDFYEHHENKINWQMKIESLRRSVENKFSLPPLIVGYYKGKLYIRDGNHRYSLYKKLGMNSCDVVIWCDSEKEKMQVRKKYNLEK